MTDSGASEEELLEKAYELIQDALDKAEDINLPSEAVASALLGVAVQVLVGDLGRDGATDVLSQLIDEIDQGRFDPDEEEGGEEAGVQA